MTDKPQKDFFRGITVYRKDNVYDAALKRIRRLFDEFPNVIVATSGGKDSTVVFELAMIVARELNRLPLSVMFIDQEAEWESTIEVVRHQMTRPGVKPYWYQIPFKLFNATSAFENWLECWSPQEESRWMRPKEEYSIKQNKYGTDRFANLFNKILSVDHAGIKSCILGGVRTDENPARKLGLVGAATYKEITWGKKVDAKAGHYIFYPIYDWDFSDCWLAINKYSWKYSTLYDKQFQIGIPYRKMRVSNVHHETAVESLFTMQEIEPRTYERLTQRIEGVDMAVKMGRLDYFPKKLPIMFADWKEYRDHLLEKLILVPEWKAKFKEVFKKHDEELWPIFKDRVTKVHITSILTNDHEMVKIINFQAIVFPLIGRMKNKEKKLRLAQEARE